MAGNRDSLDESESEQEFKDVPKKREAKSRGIKNSKRKSNANEDYSEDEENDDTNRNDSDEEVSKRTGGRVNKRKSKADKDDSEGEENGDYSDDGVIKKGKSTPKKRRSKGKVDNEDDSDDDASKRTAYKSKTNKKKTKADEDDSAEEEYEVEKILNSKKMKGKVHYLVRWKGYTSSSDTWEPENTLSCPDLIDEYEEEKKNKDVKAEKKGSKKAAKKKKSAGTPAKKAKKPEWEAEDADENAEYEVERILEVHHKKNGNREFLIHWKGWSNKYDSWEPEEHLHCSELIKKFMEKVDTARQIESRTLRVAPESTRRFTLQTQATGRRLSKRRGQQQRVRYENTD